MKRVIALALCCLLAFGGLIRPPHVLAESSKEALLNGAKLSPMKTNYGPLDDLVQKTFDRILSPDMSTYDKVRACFSYLITDATYQSNDITSSLYRTIVKEINYQSDLDRNTVCEAMGMLTNKKGTCNHFAAALMVMTRAIGLESYIATCLASSPLSGTKDHYFVVVRLSGSFYLFDARMGLLRKAEENAGFRYFCADVSELVNCWFCDLNECVKEFGGFRSEEYTSRQQKETVPGATEGNVHFSFGRYPQTLVEDDALVDRLNGLAKGKTFTSYRYYSGDGAQGSQKQWDYMRYLDVVCEGETYRGVVFSGYRPLFTYESPTTNRSYQDDAGYEPDTVYWFLYEPLEWRLTDGDSLLLCDFAVDAQPFNNATYYSKTGKTFNGALCHYFSDVAMTHPANDWGSSSLRRWLNEDFYNTAFSEEEKALIVRTTLTNRGYSDRFNYADTEDYVFLLSYNEAAASDYFLAESEQARSVLPTDYARIQGVGVYESSSHEVQIPWRLRSAGFHSDDTCFISTGGLAHYHLDAMGQMGGIRPALRLNSVESLASVSLSVPRKLTAKATNVGEVTLYCSVVNGATGYQFYQYAADGKTRVKTYDSETAVLCITGLNPGETYVFRAAACRASGGKTETSAPSDKVQILCRYLVAKPLFPSASSAGTGEISLSWESVAGAHHYNIYRYLNTEKTGLCAESTVPSVTVTGLLPGVEYYFYITAVSADGYEGKPSDTVHAPCVSVPEIPGNVTVTATATAELTVSWTASPDAQYYRVYRYTGKETKEMVGVTAGTSLAVENLYPGYNYYFCVTAVGDNGKSVSGFSPVVNALSKTMTEASSGRKTLTVMLGDIDGDWILSSADARLALRASVGFDDSRSGAVYRIAAADVDGTPGVSSADARLILRASVSLETIIGSITVKA